MISALNPPRWWWDVLQNVCLFGDPDLRVFVPGTKFSNENYWREVDTESLTYDEEISINGHMPYGATSYPHEKEPKKFLEQYQWFIIVLIIIILLILVAAVSVKRKRPKRK